VNTFKYFNIAIVNVFDKADHFKKIYKYQHSLIHKKTITII